MSDDLRLAYIAALIDLVRAAPSAELMDRVERLLWRGDAVVLESPAVLAIAAPAVEVTTAPEFNSRGTLRNCPRCGGPTLSPKGEFCRPCTFEVKAERCAGRLAPAGVLPATGSEAPTIAPGPDDTRPPKPRCGRNGCTGLLLRQEDQYGHRLVCLACGHSYDVDAEGNRLEPLPVAANGEGPQRRREPSSGSVRL